MGKQWAFIHVEAHSRAAPIELSPMEICYVMGYEKQLNHSNFFCYPVDTIELKPNQNTLHISSYMHWIEAIVRCNPSMWFLVFCYWFDSTFSDLLFISLSLFLSISLFLFSLSTFLTLSWNQTTIGGIVCVLFCDFLPKTKQILSQPESERVSISNVTNNVYIQRQCKNGTSKDLVYQSGKTDMYQFNFVISKRNQWA